MSRFGRACLGEEAVDPLGALDAVIFEYFGLWGLSAYLCRYDADDDTWLFAMG